MKTLIIVVLLNIVFGLLGHYAETLGLISKAAHWALFGYTFGFLSALTIGLGE